MILAAAYIAKSGVRYEDSSHSDCLFAAEDAGEPEVQGFPHSDDLDLEDIESRMGFVAPDGTYLTRDETLARYGFDLAEDQKEAA